jgi:hypothetical protein
MTPALFSRTVKLADVPPDFRGIPLHSWRLQEISRQCAAHVATLDSANAPLSRKAIWNPRDDYGWKGIQPTPRRA